MRCFVCDAQHASVCRRFMLFLSVLWCAFGACARVCVCGRRSKTTHTRAHMDFHRSQKCTPYCNTFHRDREPQHSQLAAPQPGPPPRFPFLFFHIFFFFYTLPSFSWFQRTMCCCSIRRGVFFPFFALGLFRFLKPRFIGTNSSGECSSVGHTLLIMQS
ncbi:unnamed protein product [Arctogadus glacialis]